MLIAARSSQDFACCARDNCKRKLEALTTASATQWRARATIQIGGTKPMMAMKNKE